MACNGSEGKKWSCEPSTPNFPKLQTLNPKPFNFESPEALDPYNLAIDPDP